MTKSTWARGRQAPGSCWPSSDPDDAATSTNCGPVRLEGKRPALEEERAEGAQPATLSPAEGPTMGPWPCGHLQPHLGAVVDISYHRLGASPSINRRQGASLLVPPKC
ncbi:hypothetical protein Y1Q_0023283 [Alligator mississippiensis]|uniref:Uncharacterized protein n=1 Tax=Alligator mississippiensis TaxID=8496 RepID=A0A151MJP8_ALLMI|nr:hypothetical protein Y1Q_0023283 [Alligator mississippiensis]